MTAKSGPLELVALNRGSNTNRTAAHYDLAQRIPFLAELPKQFGQPLDDRRSKPVRLA
jgi:hypothetical protein